MLMDAEPRQLIQEFERCPDHSACAMVSDYIHQRKLSRLVEALNHDLLDGTKIQRTKATVLLEKIGFPV